MGKNEEIGGENGRENVSRETVRCGFSTIMGWDCSSRLIGLGNMIRLPVGDGALDVPFRLPKMSLLISCKWELSP